MILKIIVIYLAAGFPVSMGCSIGLVLAEEKSIKAAIDIKNILFFLITYIFWPYFAWILFSREALQVSRCAHCGKTFHGKGEIRHHMYECELNPVVVELNGARARIKVLESGSDWKITLLAEEQEEHQKTKVDLEEVRKWSNYYEEHYKDLLKSSEGISESLETHHAAMKQIYELLVSRDYPYTILAQISHIAAECLKVEEPHA